MTKNKRISFIVLFSVFIAVLFGFGTNFVSSNATNTDNTQPTIKSYYSDENGEKIDKTEYTDDESIYSTIELSIPTSKLKYSKITVMDKSINGIQMVLKKVVDDQGNDITNEFGYENKKYNDENYSGVYTNSPNLDKNDFYNHTYKLIFEEYLSDTDLFVKNADVNGYYNLEHEYQAVFETSDGSNSVISDKITSKIKVIYTAKNPEQSLHSAHWDINFCDFILLETHSYDRRNLCNSNLFIGLEDVCILDYDERYIELSLLYILCPNINMSNNTKSYVCKPEPNANSKNLTNTYYYPVDYYENSSCCYQKPCKSD